MTIMKIVMARYLGKRITYQSEKRRDKRTSATGESVDEVADNETADNTDDGSERNGRGGLAEGNTTDEHDGFQA
jgi:hypothetical protein